MPISTDIVMAAEGPRALLGRGYLDKLRRRAETTHENEYSRLLLWARNVPHRSDDDFTHQGLAEHALFRLSLLGAMKPDDDGIAESAARMAKIVSARKPTSKYGTGSARLWSLAAYYDWCRDRVPISERERIAGIMLDYVDRIYRDEMDVIPEGTCYASGHAINQVAPFLMAGIALWDDHPRGPEIVRDVVARLVEMLRVHEHFLREGSFHMWWAYGITYMRELPRIFHIARNSLGLDWWSKCSWFENYVWWILYGLRGDWSWPRCGDFFGADVGWNPGQGTRNIRKGVGVHIVLASIAGEYANPYAGWGLSKLRAKGSKRGGLLGLEDARLLYEGRPYKVKHPRELPLSRHFPNAGVLISREGWLDGTHVTFKATPVYLHNHTHRDVGHFAIYHGGDLALDSGAYDGYETPHWLNYYIRTIAHNTLIIEDPDEEFVSRRWTLANEGGQRFVNDPHWTPLNRDDMDLDEYRSCTQIAAAATAEFDHVHVDMTVAYSPQKVRLVTRHLAVIRAPAQWPHPIVVVRDTVETAKPDLAVKWLLHTQNEPVVMGDSAAASCGEGRLHVQTILPASPVMDVVGGEGREFMAGDENFPVTRRLSPDAGQWRIEISGIGASAGGGERHDMLHCLLTADITESQSPKAAALQVSGRATGVETSGAAVVFCGGEGGIEFELARDAEAALFLELPAETAFRLSGPVTEEVASTGSGALFIAEHIPAGKYRLDAF